MDTIHKIKLLLENSTEARESYRNIIEMYRFHYSHDEVYVSDSVIERETRALKRKYPALRDSNWASRQKHSIRMRDKFRSQEKPENLSKTYTVAEDVSYKFEKESTYQWIIRKLLNF